jgi:hypothetical protein
MDLVVKDQNIALGQEQAKVLQDPDLLALVQVIATYKTHLKDIKITDADSRNKANDSLIAVRGIKKQIEEKRVAIVSFPNLFVKAINNMFKTWKNDLVRVDQKLIGSMSDYDVEEEKKALELVKKQEEIDNAPIKNLDDLPFEPDGQAKPPEVPEALAKTKKTDLGEVSRAKVLVIEIENPLALAKAAVSKGNKTIPLSVLSINKSEVKKAVAESSYTKAQWKKYGVIVKEENQYRARGK